MKFLLIILIGMSFFSCSKTSEKNNSSENQMEELSPVDTFDIQHKSRIERLKRSKRSKWKKENWYRAKDGDWYDNYLGWFRYVMQIPSDNSTDMFLGKPLFPVLVLESYKKEMTKESIIERILHLTILGNKKDINSVTIQFDDGNWETYDTIIKHNIEVHFSKEDIDEIINRLQNAKTFTILYLSNTIYFNNKDFKKYFE
jgi:hypothetical protein